MTPRGDTFAGIGYLLFSVLMFSVMAVFVKQVTDHIPVAEVVFFRNLFGILPVAAAVAVSGRIASLRTDRYLDHLRRAVIGVSAMALLFWSYALLPLADATAINFTAPLFLTALSVPLLGETVGPFRWGAVLVGFAGMLLMVHPGDGVLQAGALIGVASAFFQAMAMVLISQLSRTESSNTIVFYFALNATVLFALPLPFIWTTPESSWDWLMLAGCGISGGIAQLLLTRAYAVTRAVVLAPFGYTALLWTGLFGYLLWGQVPEADTLLGAAIVAASGVFIVYREAVRRRPHFAKSPDR